MQQERVLLGWAARHFKYGMSHQESSCCVSGMEPGKAMGCSSLRTMGIAQALLPTASQVLSRHLPVLGFMAIAAAVEDFKCFH